MKPHRRPQKPKTPPSPETKASFQLPVGPPLPQPPHQLAELHDQQERQGLHTDAQTLEDIGVLQAPLGGRERAACVHSMEPHLTKPFIRPQDLTWMHYPLFCLPLICLTCT